ncbi:hypothetical protein IMG5_019280 [Ichthyophthirius multifiliis]|uniref:Uncharacterized protein n=1 Tax=Ichthyophthirius multifiliis TaxID=5932 RepID=G0QKL2_ICHMU|nr:hypothetical protein IMG5_019280 [Ichthyophthirius multifiliis]EGR34244.1 hypothetical protein IMG5_019280 [Ichthyophthirius multifiliis]|eukprot:XP_004039548.1 hypothetical protein IMG5_019280 [Ichthyophthirius multifiliis]
MKQIIQINKNINNYQYCYSSVKPVPIYEGISKFNSINEKLRVNENYEKHKWQSKFNYYKINTDELKCIFLQDNQDYQVSIELINQFNKDLQQKNNNIQHLKNAPWKFQFFKQLYFQLKEVAQTQDRIVQSVFAKQVNLWAFEQLERLEAQNKSLKPFEDDNSFIYQFQEIKKSKKEDLNQLYSPKNNNYNNTTLNENDETSNQTQDTSKIICYPHLYMAEQLKDYQSKARTKYPEYEAPEVQLRGYKRHILSFEDPQKIMTKINEKQEKNEINKIEPQKKNSNNMHQIPKNINENQIKNQKNAYLQPQIKKFVTDYSDQCDLNDKKYNIKSNYIYYESSEDIRELKMENLLRTNRVKQIAEKREDEEKLEMMKQWAVNKSRIEKEINRKVDSSTFGNDFKQLEYKYDKTKRSISLQTNPNQQKTFNCVEYLAKRDLNHEKQNINLEDQITQQRINQVKNQYYNIIGLRQNKNDQKINKILPSLSIYDSSNCKNRFKHFSTIVNVNVKKLQKKQLDQALEIKNRMAKYKINMQMKELANAILTPSGIQNAQEINLLPEPGQRLIKNPFINEKKKKKKNKRR